MHRSFTAALLALIASQSICARAQTCDGGFMRDIGDLGGPNARAFAAAPDGSHVVGTANWNEGPERAFRWTRSPEGAVNVQNLGTVSGYIFSRAVGVSADGFIVAGYSDSSSQIQAFRWTVQTGIQVLPGLEGLGGNTVASAVSSDGNAIVGAAKSASTPFHACRWTGGPAMTIQDLGTFPGTGFESRATGVSADGAIVVGWSYANENVTQSRAFRWAQATGLQDLGTLGGWESAATAISPDGACIVGWASPISELTHAFRWTAAAGMEDLGTLGGELSTAYAVSADGSVVVGSSMDENRDVHAFRWTQASGMVDLGTFGGVTSIAHAVSADGNKVFGEARDSRGRVRAFMWTPGCPMDFSNSSGTHECDGNVDINDLLFFLTEFERGSDLADLTGGDGSGFPDNAVTIDDLLFCLLRFEAGC